MAPAPFSQVAEVDGHQIRGNGTQSLQIFVAEGGRTFMRRAIKGVGTSSPRHVEWVVGELDGVRAYFDGTHVILTRQDLNP